jgi:signal transduction histidine kinase
MLTDPEYKQVDKKEGYLEAIYRNSLRLSSLTNELLDISRIENQVDNRSTWRKDMGLQQ